MLSPIRTRPLHQYVPFCLILFLCLLIYHENVFAGDLVILRGKVTDRITKTAIPNADVSITDRRARILLGSAKTDIFGNYRIMVRTTGEPLILGKARAPRYQTLSLTYNLKSEIYRIRTLNFSLAPIPNLDTTPPQTTDSGIDGLPHKNSVTFTLGSQDDSSGVDRIYYSLDGSYPGIEYKDPVKVDKEGEYTLKYYAIDKAGNLEAVKTPEKKIIIDKTLPIGTLTINDGNPFTRFTKVNLRIGASESDCQMRLSNSSNSWNRAQPYSLTISWDLSPGDATKIIYAQLIDRAGNYSQVFSASITLDQKSPIAPKVDTSTVSYQPTYLLAGAKEIGASILINGLELVPADQNQRWAYTVRESQPGPNIFTISSRDLAGNESQNISFTVTYVPTTAVIQAQIDIAKPGDIVYVTPRTYKGNIYLREGISLVAKNALDTIIIGNNYDRGIITAEANTVISGLMISAEHITSRDSPNGIYYSGKKGGSIRITNTIIKGNISRGSGIRIDNAGSVVIVNNLITTFIYSGIDLRNCGVIEVINNTLSGNLDNGIHYVPSSGMCKIVNNIITNNLGFGIYQLSGPEPQIIAFNNFFNNKAAHSYYPGQPNYPNDTTTNISKDPVFTGEYYLSSVSPCVDAGKDTEYMDELGRRTTSIDRMPDEGNTDLGFHYFSSIGENKDFHVYPIIFLHGMGGYPEHLVDLMNKVKVDNMQVVCPVYAEDELGTGTFPKAALFSAGYYKKNKDSTQINDYVGKIGGCPTPKNSEEYNNRVSYAAQLKRIVENVCRATGSDKVNIVAHSMGGLVARAYIRWLGGEERVSKLLMIGVPNHGIPEIESFLLYLSGYKVFQAPSWMSNGEISEMNQSDSSWGGRPYIQWLNEGDETYKKVQYATIAGNYNPYPAGHSDGVVDTGNVNFTFAKFNSIIYAAHSDELAKDELSLVSSTYTVEFIRRWMFQDKIEKNAKLLTLPFADGGPFHTRQGIGYQLDKSNAVCIQVIMYQSLNNERVGVFAFPTYAGAHDVILNFKNNPLISTGVYRYDIRTYDMLGIINGLVKVNSPCWSWITDTIPLAPETSMLDVKITSAQADFSFNSDTGTEFSYKLDNEDWSAWAKEKTYTAKPLKPGPHIFWVKSRIPPYYDDPTPSSWFFNI